MDFPNPITSVHLHVMSGTGNTLRVARWVEAEAQRKGAAVRLTQVVRGAAVGEAPGVGSLTGVLFPTHGFTAPWAVWMHVFRLPRPSQPGLAAFVLATAGGSRICHRNLPGLEGTATLVVAAMLWLKGFRIRGIEGIDMPSNWTFLHWGLQPETVAAIIAAAEPKTRRFGQTLLAGKTQYGRPLAWLGGLLLLPISLMYLLLARFILGKLFFAGAACDDCGLCVARCPHGGVEWRGQSGLRPPPGTNRDHRLKPFWTLRCESCMRCMAYCPHRAVEPSWSWFALLCLCLTPPLGWLAFDQLLPGWQGLDLPRSGWLAFALNYPAKLGVLIAAYWLFWQALRLRPLRWLFTKLTPTHYWARYHEPRTRVVDLEPGR
jgi:NAD-dependent dihydropyrimidine dehydrogenase PreA subunit